MKNKSQEIIECSRWLFPAIILSGWLSPWMPLVNLFLEVFSWL